MDDVTLLNLRSQKKYQIRDNYIPQKISNFKIHWKELKIFEICDDHKLSNILHVH